MKKVYLFILVSLLLMSTNSITHADKPALTADLIIINANIHTMDAARPAAQALAIIGNRIVAVDSNGEIKKLGGANTRVVDANGQLILPGFNDAHVHFMSGGFQLSSVDLRDANTPQEFVERIRDFAAKSWRGWGKAAW